MSEIYRGIVEDNIDPDHYFRVRVRIKGIHADSISTENLPFAEVMSATTFGLCKGVGISSVLQIGTWVWVMLENENPNKPIVIGVVTGVGDPGTALNGKDDEAYTSVQSWTTKSGHSIVIGDVSGDENITITHRTGTQIKIDYEGNIFVNGVKNAQYDIAENVTWNIGKDLTINVQGNRSESIKGNSTDSIEGNRSESVKGNADDSVQGNVSETFSSNWTVNNSGSISYTTSTFGVNAPSSSFSGNVSIGGNLSGGGGRARSGGNATFTGTVTASQDVIGGGKSLKGHTHGVINHSTTTPPN